MEDVTLLRWWSNKWLRRSVILLAVAMLVSLPVLLWNALGQAQYNAAIERTRAVDPLLTYDEIYAAMPVIPDDENGAIYFKTLVPEIEVLNEALNASDRMKDLVIVGYADQPPLGERWNDEMSRLAAEHLEQNAPLLDKIDKLADYETGRFVYDMPENPIELLMPNLGPLRTAAKLKCLQALQSAHKEDFESMLRHLEAATTAGRFGDESIGLIEALVGVAIDALVVTTFQRALAITELNNEQLDRVDQQLGRMVAPDRMKRSLRGERAIFIDATEFMLRNPTALSQLVNANVPLGLARKVPGSTGLFRRDIAKGIDHYTRILKTVQQDVTDPKLLDALDTPIVQLHPIYILSRSILPSFTRAIQLETLAVAKVRAARVGIALEKYRLVNNAWPQTLDELVPAYIDAIPEDPFTKQPLLYEVDTDRIVVYSVGEDGEDDGGDVRERRVTTGQNPLDTGFVLLNPDQRNRPATTTQPAAE